MKRIDWLKNRWILGGAAFATLLIIFIVGVENKFWPSWTGFVPDVETSKTIEKRPDGTVTKLTETLKNQSGKTIWDVLGLLGVPLVLTSLGLWYQGLQQKRVNEQAKEEVLQAYFDRLSTLLVDKNLINLAKNSRNKQNKEIEIATATNVIQAWTKSVLRRLEKDQERKIDVLQFLINTEVLSTLKVEVSQFNLKDLNLRGIDLQKANLEGINFQGVNLSNAKFNGAILKGANLSKASLTKAKFFYLGSIYKYDIDAEVDWYEFVGTDLSGANLSEAELDGADLRFVNFDGANLRKAILNEAIFSDTVDDYDPETGFYIARSVPTNFTRAVLCETSLEKLNLTGVVFKEAKLKGAILNDADFSDADLSGVDLSSADLRRANLCSVNLENASLKGAFLVDQPGKAKMRDANFQNVKFQGAILIRVYLSVAKNLTLKQLTGEDAPWLCKVQLPKELQGEVDGNRDCEKLPKILQERYPDEFKTIEDAKAYIDEL